MTYRFFRKINTPGSPKEFIGRMPPFFGGLESPYVGGYAEFHLPFGSHSSTRLPSGSIIQANRP